MVCKAQDLHIWLVKVVMCAQVANMPYFLIHPPQAYTCKPTEFQGIALWLRAEG